MLGARIYTEHNYYLWALGNRGRIFCFKPSIHSEVLDLCDQRRQLKQQKYISSKAGLEYRKVNREVRKKIKAAKEEWIEEQCKDMENGMMSGNSKEAYNTLKALTKTCLLYTSPSPRDAAQSRMPSSA